MIMRKIIFLLLLFLPMTLFAKKDIVLHYNDINGTNVYEDSIVSIKLSLYLDSELGIFITNQTENRISIEWENVKINGTHISFSSDDIYDYNDTKSDEVLTAYGVLIKTITKRYSVLMPIVDKKKIKKEGSDCFYLLLPIRTADNIHDYKFKIYATIE